MCFIFVFQQQQQQQQQQIDFVANWSCEL